jgi:Na+-driven multidrug efflux pump
MQLDDTSNQLTFKQLIFFFIPLGLSASLVTLSHVIINSTLARAPDPEWVIASYAIGLSLLSLTERPGVLLRQTASALVRDRHSFRAVARIMWVFLAITLCIGALISYTYVGSWIFSVLFGADNALVTPIQDVYKVLMFVTLFSALRCLYQGIIIAQMRTKWLTIGMVVRIIVMYTLSIYFIRTNQITSGQVGAWIFLIGMMTEALISYLEGRLLVKKLPAEQANHSIRQVSDAFRFYRPLLYSAMIAAVISPAINAVLGKTVQLEIAIASFALAASLMQLVISFFSYSHQIVLNFYRVQPAKVHQFALMINFIPGFLMLILNYTPAGRYLLEHLMGVSGPLLTASLQTLQIFTLFAFLFPWLDFLNGVVMYLGQTQIMMWSQLANVAVTLITLVLCILWFPHWNGMIGAAAMSLGLLGETVIVVYILRWNARRTGKWITGK